jgi:hypothetical protein
VKFKVIHVESFEMSGTAHPVTQHHTPEDLNVLKAYCNLCQVTVIHLSCHSEHYVKWHKVIYRVSALIRCRPCCQPLFRLRLENC